MIFVLGLLAIFITVSIYFYFRAEGLQRDITALKRASLDSKKESQVLIDTLALMAKKNEEFIKFRFNKMAKELSDDNEFVVYLTPLVANYAAIVRESLKGKARTNIAIKKSCQAYDSRSFSRLTAYITKSDGHIKRTWNSNSLSGFMSFVEMLLNEMEQQKETKD
ncbi:hypothetical protein [Thalassotalea piscium]|uniref:Exonuclease V gamma subunit n=1 Tax=Thalassotalea piscium TaxID=1230533 RepID=A0A7X0NFN2_9GAMM|nr:hypothetical protein [Thalassotalea piscium]MBB6542560.1 exonuclease V gamma subunit [Thalassotalea piscium]